MAHEIEASDAALYVRQPAWHRLGTVLDTPPANVAEALRLAGMTWTVESVPVEVRGRPVDGYRANVRSDTGDVLGVVGASYRVAQNAETFAILDAAREVGGTVETLGSVRGGKLVYASVRLPADFKVAGDEHEAFAVVVARHDGGGAIRAFASPVRVVCMNTIRLSTGIADRAAGGTAESGVAIPHRGDLRGSLEAARGVFGAMVERIGVARDVLAGLAARPIEPAQFRAFIEAFDVPPVAPDADGFGTSAEGIAAFDAARAKYEAARDRWAARRLSYGAAMNGIAGEGRGTWYAAYNAATEVLQHGAGAPSEARATSLMFGAGADRTAGALSLAVAMSGGAS